MPKTRAIAVLLGVVVGVALAGCLGSSTQSSAAPPAEARSVTKLGRGLCLYTLLRQTVEQRAAVLDEVAYSLRAEWVRIEVEWRLGEPAEDAYDETYLTTLAQTCRMAADRGLRVMITLYSVPKWASQSDLWNEPVPGYAPGYRDYFLPATGALPGLRDFMRRVGKLCGATVQAYECWNEPNLWVFFCPQTRGSDVAYAARRYVRMLAAFSAGVRAAAPHGTQVVAGATSPSAVDGPLTTSAQTFFAQIKQLGAAKYMDAVSHHPYQVGSDSRFPPDRMPSYPETMVAMANLDTLTDLFPGKTIYLSEFAYCVGVQTPLWRGVGPTLQSQYLKIGFSYAAKLPRVRALFWYQLQDSGTWTTGLRNANGTARPSWYAFSRASRLSLAADRRVVARGTRTTFGGALTWAAVGARRSGIADKRLVVERHGGGGWIAVAHTHSRADGSFAIAVRLSATADYRVRWVGVVTSRRVHVVVR